MDMPENGTCAPILAILSGKMMRIIENPLELGVAYFHLFSNKLKLEFDGIRLAGLHDRCGQLLAC